MGKIESIMKTEMQRLTKREVRVTVNPLRKELLAVKRKLSKISKEYAVIERWAKKQVRQAESKGTALAVTQEEAKTARLSPKLIAKIRKRLGVSQRELAILAGVSTGAVASWEKGKSKPKLEKKSVLVALRKAGKREIKKILAGKAGMEPKKAAKPKPRRRKAAKVAVAVKKAKAVKKARVAKVKKTAKESKVKPAGKVPF